MKEEKRKKCVPISGLETNESLFFPVSAPDMRQSVIEGQESTYMSHCDREITQRWQNASATSITCSVLPAIIRPFKETLKWFQKRELPLCQQGFCPDDWPKWHLLLLWIMAKDCTNFNDIFSSLLLHLMNLFVSSLFADTVVDVLVFFFLNDWYLPLGTTWNWNNNGASPCFFYLFWSEERLLSSGLGQTFAATAV